MRVFVSIALSLVLVFGVVSSFPENANDSENLVGGVKDHTNEDNMHKYGKQMTSNGNAEQRSKVRKLILSSYDKMNIPDDAAVTFGVNVFHIDIDESRRSVESDVWLRVTWTDSRLSWNKEEMGVTHMRIGPNEIWRPDITLYNNRMHGGAIEQCKDTNMIVYSTGNVLWVPPCHISANCDLTFSRGSVLAPVQDCSFKFGSWTYDGLIMDLKFYNQTSPEMDITYLSKSEWRITKNNAEIERKFYSCCKEPYLNIRYNFTLSREINEQNCRI